MTRFIMLLIVLLIPVSLNGCIIAEEMAEKVTGTIAERKAENKRAEVRKQILEQAKQEAPFDKKLDTAIRARNIPEVKRVLKARPETVDIDERFGRYAGAGPSNDPSISHYSINAEIARAFIEAGADIEYEAQWGAFPDQKVTVLSLAADAGDHETVKLLIEAGADVNHRVPKQPPSRFLRVYVPSFSLEFILLPIESLTVQNQKKGIQGISIEVIKLLLDAGAEVTQDAKIWAYETGRMDIIKLIDPSLEGVK